MSKPKIAFFEFTSCEGCQLTVIDSLQTHPELLDAVEIVQFREMTLVPLPSFQATLLTVVRHRPGALSAGVLGGSRPWKRPQTEPTPRQTCQPAPRSAFQPAPSAIASCDRAHLSGPSVRDVRCYGAAPSRGEPEQVARALRGRQRWDRHCSSAPRPRWTLRVARWLELSRRCAARVRHRSRSALA